MSTVTTSPTTNPSPTTDPTTNATPATEGRAVPDGADRRGAEHPAVVLDALSVSFTQQDGSVTQVLKDISLEVPVGQFIAVVGRSGGGKTTVLNAVAGLVPASGGSLKVLGKEPSLARSHLGFMPARDALLPWRTALRNVEYGLELRGVPRKERRATAQAYLEMVGLGHAASRWPWQLSQGMRQRVALARAWALEPDLLLMDEPFAALDAQTRESVREEFLKLLGAGPRRTVVFVTHDLEEAVILADRVVVLGAGTIIEDITLPQPKDRDADGMLESHECITVLRDLRRLLKADH